MNDLTKSIENIESHVDAWRAKESKRVDELHAMVNDLAQNRIDSPANFGGLKSKQSKLGDAVKSDEALRLFKGEARSACIVLDNPLLSKSLISGDDQGSPASATDTFSPANRLNDIVPNGQRRLRLVDAIASIPASSNQVSATVEGATVSAAAGQTKEGALVGESEFVFDLLTLPVVTIAHSVSVSNQVMQDSPALERFLNTRMNQYVLNRLEHEIINGTGGVNSYSGLTKAGNFTAYNPVTGDTALDSIRKAIASMEVAEFYASAILLHPSDWAAIELTKDQSDAYILGNGGAASFVSNGMVANLWGVPVIPSKSVAQGKFIVADLNGAVTHWLRQDTTVELGYVGSQFTSLQASVLASMRGALIVTNKAGVIYGDLEV